MMTPSQDMEASRSACLRCYCLLSGRRQAKSRIPVASEGEAVLSGVLKMKLCCAGAAGNWKETKDKGH